MFSSGTHSEITSENRAGDSRFWWFFKGTARNVGKRPPLPHSLITALKRSLERLRPVHAVTQAQHGLLAEALTSAYVTASGATWSAVDCGPDLKVAAWPREVSTQVRSNTTSWEVRGPCLFGYKLCSNTAKETPVGSGSSLEPIFPHPALF